MIVFKEKVLNEAVNIANLSNAVLTTLVKGTKQVRVDMKSGDSSFKGETANVKLPISNSKCRLMLVFSNWWLEMGSNEIFVYDGKGSIKETVIYNCVEIRDNEVIFKHTRSAYYISIRYR